MINAQAYDPQQDFVEQATHVPDEARYDLTLTNVEYYDRSPKTTIITFEWTIDNGPEKSYVVPDKVFFSKSGKQDYANAIVNAMCFASGIAAPTGALSAKDYALYWPVNKMRLSADCVYEYEISAWLDKNSYKSATDDQENGWTKRGLEETETLKYKKTLRVEKDDFDAWSGEKYRNLVVRRGGYVELPLIYQPPENDSQRAAQDKDRAEFAEAQFATDDQLPF